MKGGKLAVLVVILLAAFAAWEARIYWPVSAPLAPPPVTPPPIAPPPPAPAITPANPPPSPAPKKIEPKKTPAKIVPPKAVVVRPIPPAVLPTVPPVPAPLENPPAPQEWQGNDTSVTHTGQVVIHNDRQWVHFWSEHRPHEAAPEIDFARDMVIGVFAGPRPADPFSIKILQVRPAGNTLVVDYRERLPPPGTFAVNVTVYPYDLKVIPSSTLPVKFNLLAPENVVR